MNQQNNNVREVLELRGIGKSFGAATVLQNLDWSVSRGKVIGLLGRNGAGKSTLIECLLGLREIDRGSATLFGDTADDLSDVTRARIGYVPQKPDLFEWLTPLQMLAYFKALYPRWNEARVNGLLQRWGFTDSKLQQAIGSLSVGEKQRLSIVRALAHEPELLILDEPVASLDPLGRRDFLRELIDDVVERDTTVIFSTHILSDLERIALDVAFLKDGRIALQAGLDELLEGARRITGPDSALAALRVQNEIRRGRDSSGVTSLVVQMDAAQLAQVESGHPALRVEALNLEDLFIEVTQ